jgi:hypothetical protein
MRSSLTFLLVLVLLIHFVFATEETFSEKVRRCKRDPHSLVEPYVSFEQQQKQQGNLQKRIVYNANCSAYDNCYTCLEDSSCGWYDFSVAFSGLLLCRTSLFQKSTFLPISLLVIFKKVWRCRLRSNSSRLLRPHDEGQRDVFTRGGRMDRRPPSLPTVG